MKTDTFSNEISKALKALAAGETILYPTDTIWGIGCDATNAKAVERVIRIKKRPPEKGFIILVSDQDMLKKYIGIIPATVTEFLNTFEGSITMVYPTGTGLAAKVKGPDESVAARIVRDKFCIELIEKFGKPIVSTSANESGKPFPVNFNDIKEEIKKKVGYAVIYRTEETALTKPSSVVTFNKSGEVLFLRK